MFPEINRIRKISSYIGVFRGLDRTVNAGFSRVARNSDTFFTEFADMQNLCSDDYPRLRTRKKRKEVELSSWAISSNLLAVNNKLIYTNSDGYLVYGTVSKSITGYQSGEHTLILYGNIVIIFPEKLYCNLSTFSTLSEVSEKIDFSFTSQSVNGIKLNRPLFDGGNYKVRTRNFGDFSIEKVALDDNGVPLNVSYIYEKASGLEDYSKQTNPSNPTEAGSVEPWQGEYFTHWNTTKIGETVEAQGESPSGVYRCTDINTGGTNTVNGQTYNTHNALRTFVRIDSYYVRIWRTDSTNDDHFENLKAGDFVKISDMDTSGNSVRTGMLISETLNSLGETIRTYWGGSENFVYPSGYWGNYLNVLNNNTFKVYYVDKDSIVIKANIDRSVPYTGAMTISRVMPPVDSGMMIEVNNRLWACSSENNEIYCCKQGDCTNWQAYGDGISTDSFAATVGCEGDFTGIARQNDSVIFFKENWIIKLFGTRPSNYTLATYNAQGVESGSEKSVVWINGVLYYLSPSGVCRYSPGGQPEVISESAFGNVKYKNGVGGRHRNKYFLSAQRDDAQTEDDGWELFVFDTEKGLWHKEDDTKTGGCTTYNNLLYYLNDSTLICAENGTSLISAMNGAEDEESFEWFFETPNFYEDDFRKKYISKLQLHINGDHDMHAVIYAQFKPEGAWVKLRHMRYQTKRQAVIPVLVRRSDYLRLRVEGTGYLEVSAIQVDYSVS